MSPPAGRKGVNRTAHKKAQPARGLREEGLNFTDLGEKKPGSAPTVGRKKKKRAGVSLTIVRRLLGPQLTGGGKFSTEDGKKNRALKFVI